MERNDDTGLPAETGQTADTGQVNDMGPPDDTGQSDDMALSAYDPSVEWSNSAGLPDDGEPYYGSDPPDDTGHERTRKRIKYQHDRNHIFIHFCTLLSQLGRIEYSRHDLTQRVVQKLRMQTDHEHNDYENDERQKHHPVRIFYIRCGCVIKLFSRKKGSDHNSQHIDCRQQRRYQNRAESHISKRIPAFYRSFCQIPFADKAAQSRHPHQRKRSYRKNRKHFRHLSPQPVQLMNIRSARLINDGTGTEERTDFHDRMTEHVAEGSCQSERRHQYDAE